ncbi:MAG: glutathione S-transferase family protein [Rhodospirillales bacterium]
MPLTLRSSPSSPFARKVRMAAIMLGLTDRIKIETAVTTDPNDTIRRQNPLGKIPALVLDDGTVMYDSRVILEYLDALAGGGKIFPVDTGTRFKALVLAALGDGIVDAGLLVIYEKRYRPEETPYKPWLDYQRDKIKRAIEHLESSPPASDPVTVGSISLACALGHLDFRKQVDWRPMAPALVEWLDDFAAKVPAYGETMPG